jgi:hypothetical protein
VTATGSVKLMVRVYRAPSNGSGAPSPILDPSSNDARVNLLTGRGAQSRTGPSGGSGQHHRQWLRQPQSC